MTVPALDVLRRVRARWTNDIGWPANDEEHDLYEQSDVALADLDALVQAAQPGDDLFRRAEVRWMSMEDATIEVPARWLAELGRARARVTGEAR